MTKPFHPLTKKYRLMPPIELRRLADDMKETGFDPRFPVIIFEQQILDGRDRELASEMAGVDPIYEFFEGTYEEAKALAKRANQLRKHYTKEELDELREERVEEVVAAAEEGKTIREIAADLDISPSTVHADLVRGRTNSTDNGSGSNPPAPSSNGVNHTTTGGKGPNPSKPRRTRAVIAKLLCSKCERLPASVKDCPSCESVRQKKKDDDKAAREKEKSDKKAAEAAAKAAALKAMEIKDDEGIIVPERCKPAFDVAKTIGTICRDLDKTLKQIQEIASGPGGRLLRFESIKQQLRDTRGTLWANRATHVCPYCQGELQKKKACEACKDDGWVSHHIWKQAPGNDKKAERTAAAS